MAKLALEEQETIIRFDRANDTADIYTHEPRLIKKLLKLELEHPDQVFSKRLESDCVEYVIPKKYILIKSTSARCLTDEYREILSRRMREINARQGKSSQ